jgi:hypothetical protein
MEIWEWWAIYDFKVPQTGLSDEDLDELLEVLDNGKF